MTQEPQDRPFEAPVAGGIGGAGGTGGTGSAGGTGGVGQPYTGPTPGPYAGPPGTPMPEYDAAGADGPRDHQGATIAFILGIFSVVGFVFLGPVAWIMANKAIKEMDPSVGSTYQNRSGGTSYRNRSLASAAKVLGIIGTIFLILAVVVVIGGIAVVVIAAKNSGS